MLSAPVWRGFGPLAFFGVGLVLGAVSVAFIAAVVGGIAQALLPVTGRLGAVAVVGIAVLLREAGLIRLPVPENRRLVPEHVQTKGRIFGPIQFGFEMGTGMRTYSPSALPHLVLVAIVLVLPLAGAMAAGLGFAAARWIMAAASIWHSDDGAWTRIWLRNARLLAIALAGGTAAALAAASIVSA